MVVGNRGTCILLSTSITLGIRVRDPLGVVPFWSVRDLAAATRHSDIVLKLPSHGFKPLVVFRDSRV